MKTFSIRRRSFLPITAGLATAQAIGFFYVWQSNLALDRCIDVLRAAGWLTVPSGPAAEALKTFGAAFWGGLFFTLSVGVGLTLAALALLFVWQRCFHGNRPILLAFAAAWLIAIIAVNCHGPTLFPTLFVVCVPLATSLAAMQTRAPSAGPPAAARRWYLPLITLALLTALWSTQLNQGLFVDIRDHLLLSNAIGRRVNDFYYRYTLFAARAFKSFEQKTVRSARLEPGPHMNGTAYWVDLLAKHDVLVVPERGPADVTIRISDTTLQFTAPNGAMIEADQAAFQKDPRQWLGRFSAAADRHGPFRRAALFGLLVGFPILLYMLVDGAIGRMAGLVVQADIAVWVRSATCMVIGVALLLPLLVSRAEEVSADQLAEALTASSWPRRVAALRLIEAKRMEIAAYRHYRPLLESPLVVERYWLARALGSSRHPATYADLLRLMQDPNANVVCQAYYALGKRGQRAAVKAIEAQMVQSDHWYTQWYGYHAIRRLGWHQRSATSGP